MSERYDPEEDRANDIKKHDNPNHPSYHNHELNMQTAKDKLDDWYLGDAEKDND